MTSKAKKSRWGLKTELTIRYLAGIAVIATLVVFAFLEHKRILSAKMSDAEAINIAGAQRMLSQRAALLSYRIFDDPTPVERQAARAQLYEALERMREGHAYLTQPNAYGLVLSQRNASLRALYSDDGGGLDARVRSFINTFDTFNAFPSDESDNVANYRALAQGELLAQLDQAVTLYEQAARASVLEATRMNAILTASILLLLAIVSVGIFRPLVRKVAGDIKTLESERDERTRLLSRSFAIAKMGHWRVEEMGSNQMWVSVELAELFELEEAGLVPAHGLVEVALEGETDKFLAAYHEAWNTQKPQRVVTKYRLKSGREIYVQHLITPDVDESTGKTALVGVARDVSVEERARREAERSRALLQQRAEDLADAQELAAIAFWRLELSTRRLEWDIDMYSLLRFDIATTDVSIDMLTERVCSPDDVALVMESQRRAVHTREPQVAEVKVRRGDDTEAYLAVRSKVETDESGKSIALFGTVQDITELKQAEAALDDSRMLLEKRAAELHEANRLGQLGSWRMGIDKTWIAFSDDMFRLTRLDPETFKPGPATVRPRYQGDSLERIWAAHAELLQSGETQIIDIQFLCGDGEVRDLELRSQVAYDADGRAQEIFGTAQDVSHNEKPSANWNSSPISTT